MPPTKPIQAQSGQKRRNNNNNSSRNQQQQQQQKLSNLNILPATAIDTYSSTPATFLLPAAAVAAAAASSTTTSTSLHLEPWSHAQFGLHQHQQHQHHQQSSSSSSSSATTNSSYTFVHIKREPCQVSEISSNCSQLLPASTPAQHQQQQQRQNAGGVTSSSPSSSSTSTSRPMPALVKIEAASPKVDASDKSAATLPSTNNSVPIGIAVARKRPQETLAAATPSLSLAAAAVASCSSSFASSLTASSAFSSSSSNSGGDCTANASAMPLGKELGCYGIRFADFGAATGAPSCAGNFYFTGNGDLVTGSATTAEELAFSSTGIQSVNRAASSTFWQYPNALPIDSVISMSPATVGLQYSRDANRGQVVLLPATPALGISNYPIYAPTDPFQQAAAAAAFVWPSAYIPQAAAGNSSAAAAAASLQPPPPPPNFIFPTMGAAATAAAAAPSYAASLQLYLAAAAAAGNPSLYQQHHQPQQTTLNLCSGSGGANISSSSSSCTTTTTASAMSTLNLSLSSSAASNVFSSSSNSISSATSSRLLSFATTAPNGSELASLLPTVKQPIAQKPYPAIAPFILPPTTLKIEEFAQHHQQHQQHLPPQTVALNFDMRDRAATAAGITRTTTTNECVLETETALNLMRIPTPPASANMESAAPPVLLNLTTSAALTPIEPATSTVLTYNGAAMDAVPAQPPPPADEISRSTSAVISAAGQGTLLPQMQDVNIQTDTPVCSEDENSSYCNYQQQPATPPPPVPPTNSHQEQEPMELVKTNEPTAELADEHAVNVAIEPPPPQVELQYEVNADGSGEEMSGLELLSNISTSSAPMLRVKQEPAEQQTPPETNVAAPPAIVPTPLLANTEQRSALNLLCDLAVALNTQSNLLDELTAGNEVSEPAVASEATETANAVYFSTATTPTSLSITRCYGQTPRPIRTPPSVSPPTTTTMATFKSSCQTFPSMDGIELPSTSSAVGSEKSADSTPIKQHKKHKHSKSSSSAASTESQKFGVKKSKKKHKHKQRHQHNLTATDGSAADDDIDANDELLQAQLRNALHTIDPNKRIQDWPNLEQVISLMDTNMRTRLADMTRQYRKRKRKLEEISKHKKKKKCTRHLQSMLEQQPAPPPLPAPPRTHHHPLQLSMTSALGSLHSSSGSSLLSNSSPFSKFSMGSSHTPHKPGTTSSYLQPSSFLRFSENKTHTFPPPPSSLTTATNKSDTGDNASTSSAAGCSAVRNSTSPFVRLEPSSLDGANHRGLSNSSSTSSSPLSANNRLAATQLPHASNNNKTLPPATMAARRSSANAKILKRKAEPPATTTAATPAPVIKIPRERIAVEPSSSPSSSSANDLLNLKRDRELQLTSEHLYRKETRVLMDNGGRGFFYAGVMKALRPPDIYAVYLDGERGNKSQIMSREEILKDTILEMTPENKQCVPVGTRLCAFWSQQYRCLYPGRVIESEASGEDSEPYVSVEFDDGDSGRIKLQHTRFLLSSYPIVEYNDNNLYPLGKSRKCGLRAEHERHPAGDSNHNHLHLASNNTPNSIIDNGFGKELFSAERIEKRRLKRSLKHKLNANGASGTASVGGGRLGSSSSGSVNGNGNTNDNDELSRKHHKHKKHKKHKKHHRRMTASSEAATLATSPASTSADNQNSNQTKFQLKRFESFLGSEIGGKDKEFNNNNNTRIEPPTLTKPNNSDDTNNAQSVIKSEGFELEEETTTMTSELSDETKAADEMLEQQNKSKGSSKIAAFLPDRQLWGWCGAPYRKAPVRGRIKKQFYKSIKRNKETIMIGDSAVFLSTGRPDRPYIGRIVSMWEVPSGNKVVRVRWFYHPEETTGCPKLKYPGALFESPHEDENDVQTISHRCEVLQFERYFEKFGADTKQYQSIYDNNDTYYLAGHYNPRTLVLKLQDDIPTFDVTAAAGTATSK